MTTIGDSIRILREKNNLTQIELAELSGVSKTAIGDIETGVKTRLSAEQKKGILNALKISAEEFEKILEEQEHAQYWIFHLILLLTDLLND